MTKKYGNHRYWLGLFAYVVSTVLSWTLKIRIVNHPEYNFENQYLFAFWHGKQLLPVLKFNTHKTAHAVLVSSSKDGDILTEWLKRLGYEVVRGSSRRRNISALVGMMKKLKEGFSLGFGVDGPIGPIYKVKPGMTYMAQKVGIEIVPVGTALSHKWVFNKAWDRYEVPKPFSSCACYLGKPLYIDKDADLEQWNLVLEEAIQQAEAKALSLLT